MVLVPPPVVSPEFRAMPLGRLLPLLGPRLGRKLEASPAMRDLVMVVRPAKGAPDAILASIARVAFARWTVGSDGTARLDPDPAARAAGRVAERRERIEKWRLVLAEHRARYPFDVVPNWEALARDLANAAAAPPPTLGMGSLDDGLPTRFERSRPARRLISRVLATLTPEILEEAAEGTIVFADQPNAAQRPLPRRVAEAVSMRTREQAAWLAAFKQVGYPPKIGQHEVGWLAVNARPATEAARVLVRVAPEGFHDSRVVNISLYGTDGKRIEHEYAQISYFMLPSSASPAPPASPTRAYSDRAIQHANLWRGEVVAPAIAKAALNVVENDPHSGRATEELIAYSEWKDRPLVALMREGDMLQYTDSVFPAARAENGWTIREREGVLEAVPPNPIRTLTQFLDRTVLKRRLALNADSPRNEIMEVYGLLPTSIPTLGHRLPLWLDERYALRHEQDGVLLFASFLRAGGTADEPIPVERLDAIGLDVLRRHYFRSNTAPPSHAFEKITFEDEATVRFPDRRIRGTVHLWEPTRKEIELRDDPDKRGFTDRFLGPAFYGMRLREAAKKGGRPDDGDPVRAILLRSFVVTLKDPGGRSDNFSFDFREPKSSFGPVHSLPAGYLKEVEQARRGR